LAKSLKKRWCVREWEVRRERGRGQKIKAGVAWKWRERG
jgi:hypothetical protein